VETTGRLASLSPVLIALFRGVLYRDQSPDHWLAMMQLQPRVRDQASLFGLELVVDEAEGYAYLRQRPAAEGEEELPRLVQRRQLGFGVSLLLALLRRKLAEHDAGGWSRSVSGMGGWRQGCGVEVPYPVSRERVLSPVTCNTAVPCNATSTVGPNSEHHGWLRASFPPSRR
jgi:hypothetical protein